MENLRRAIEREQARGALTPLPSVTLNGRCETFNGGQIGSGFHQQGKPHIVGTTPTPTPTPIGGGHLPFSLGGPLVSARPLRCLTVDVAEIVRSLDGRKAAGSVTCAKAELATLHSNMGELFMRNACEAEQ